MSSSSSSSSSSSEEKKKKKKKEKKKDKKKVKKSKDKKSKKNKKKDKKDKKDPYSANAREKARLEAQARLMGADSNGKAKKKSKKKKKSSSSSSESDSAEAVRKLQDRVDDKTLIREQEQADAAENPVEEPEKPYDEMTWPERAAAAAHKAESEAIWSGASKQQAMKAAEEAGEAVMRRASQFGYVEPVKPRAKFNAATGATQKLSPVEQVRLGGLTTGIAATPGKGGGKINGRGLFGMAAPGGERAISMG
eukprot:TRINITY_DN5379_c0_g1_i1.p1 TRINITY_DN5379_c0_g1~~TRINITY_DN5379_c0_g1_i1.p1  ORF type:complete len:251 (+),score=69.74 TRINITY_DN5379_c0_g1_i1:35-787(+)